MTSKYFSDLSPVALPLSVRENSALPIISDPPEADSDHGAEHADPHYFDRSQILAVQEMSQSYPQFIKVSLTQQKQIRAPYNDQTPTNKH